MAVSTAELMKNIQIAVDMGEFREKNRSEFLVQPPHEFLHGILLKKGLELSRVCTLSGIDASYCYRIFSGTRTPSRNALLHIAITMKLSIDETQHALRLYQLARLDPRCYRDAAILFAISKGYTHEKTTALLSELGEDVL